MSLFSKQNVVLNSGKSSDFKIECDHLTDDDWECLAYLISKKIKFGTVISVPSGGDKLFRNLLQYCSDDSDIVLICDDVLTTGGSMERIRNSVINENNIEKSNIKGVVIFERGDSHEWITPLFKMI